MEHPNFNEDFLHFESKVNQLMKLLEEMSTSNKGDDEEATTTKKPEKKNIYDEIDENNIIVSVKTNRTVLNKEAANTETITSPDQMDKFTFMQQIEQDAEDRAKARKERERIAQNFRTMGNDAFRKNNFERAILLYTRGIDHIKDSPILYNNRALCYIKLKNYMRAVIDCDYVINKLEEKNLRSWLYRAVAYKMAGDEKNFSISVDNARKTNPKKQDYIIDFLEKAQLQGI